MRLILLIDMDYFFVACEELRHPEIKGKPVIVGFDPKEGRGRGVVSTCNYEARKFGIHSAMPISIAYRIKPDAIFLPIDYAYYEKVSKSVVELAKRYSQKCEQVSIDEVFLDVSEKIKDYDGASEYAKEIKRAISDELHLPCSIGVSVNKLLAKMACEAAKPNGIKLVKQEGAKAFLRDIPIGKLYGVGQKTEERLKAMGYKTIGDVADSNSSRLSQVFKNFGNEIYNSANGIDDSEIIENWEVKSIGRERTFEEDTAEKTQIEEKIKEVSKEVFEELKAQNFYFKTVTVKIRYSDFTEHLKSKSLLHPSNDLQTIIDTAIKLFEQSAEEGRKVRKIGVRTSTLSERKGQKKIFNS